MTGRAGRDWSAAAILELIHLRDIFGQDLPSSRGFARADLALDPTTCRTLGSFEVVLGLLAQSSTEVPK